jgi:hypothetical protein
MAAKHLRDKDTNWSCNTINVVTFRLAILVSLTVAAAANLPGLAVRGKLAHNADHQPVLIQGSKQIVLSGDAPTLLILNDERVQGSDFEAIGHFTAPDHFEIDPIHTVAMFVYKEGKRSKITYWCDVCYIRTLAPGTCVCCQKYTDLDLQDPDAQ